eukprot:TRINITY_DN1334_c0_g1_i1.p1 TRINITY_DN1334_c0_g1~~TRINITY_DN1334_c0_g1_i1.p1  ORF type:complete len:279 (-),score=36.68 TRINITY_DN1334_c0_g1_i1:182-1018(-)
MDTQFFLELDPAPLSDTSGSEHRREDSVLLGAAPGEGRNASSISTASPQHFTPSTQPQLVQSQPHHYKQSIQSSPQPFLQSSSPQRRKTERGVRATTPTRAGVSATPDSPSMVAAHNGSTTPYEKDNFRACSIPAPMAMPWVNSLPSRSREAGDHLPVQSTAVASSLRPESYHQLKMKYLRSLNINLPNDRPPPQRTGRDRGVSMPPAFGSSSSHTMPMAVPIKSDIETTQLAAPPPTVPVGTVIDAPFVPPHELVNHADSFSLYHYNQRKQGAKHAV